MNKKGFSLVELLTVVAIIGILAAIAGPMYGKYVRKSRTSEAVGSLGAIALFEETYFSESSSYVSVAANPSGAVPTSTDTGGRKPFSSGESGWNLLGRVMPDGTQVYFQYEVKAGQFNSAGSSVTPGSNSTLIAHSTTFVPGGSSCTPNLTARSASAVGVPVVASSNWFFATAVGNQKAGGACSLFIKVVDRPDIYKENESE